MSSKEWLLAPSAWWGRWFGRCALRLRDGVPGSAPVEPEKVPPGARIRELDGTILPGLRDAHVHSGLVDLRAVRAGGISEVHDLGSAPEALGSDDPGLPRVRCVGAILTAPGGYPSDRTWSAPGSFREVHSPIEAEAAVDEQLQVDAEAIKIALNADAGPLLDDHVLTALVDAAHGAGLDVIAHVEGERTVRIAHEHGIDRLAHTPWTECVDDGLIAELAQRMSWISTLDIHGYGTATPQLRTALYNLRRFIARGGGVHYGTDLGNGPLPLGVNPREVTALLAAGLTPEDVLTSMTDLRGTASPCWVPHGLDPAPDGFATSLSTAKVLGTRDPEGGGPCSNAAIP